MKFAEIVGLSLSITGLILYLPPLQNFLFKFFGEPGRLIAAVMFASGWALLFVALLFHLGVQSRKKL